MCVSGNFLYKIWREIEFQQLLLKLISYKELAALPLLWYALHTQQQ